MFAGQFEKAVNQYELFLQDKEGWSENKVSACGDLYNCYKKLDNAEKALEFCFKSFVFDTPRAEIACKIGGEFLERKQYYLAKYWYKTALTLTPDPLNLGFIQRDFFEYIPAIQLAVVCDNLKEYEEANNYNEMAGRFKPLSSAYKNNKKYFSQRLSVL
jgi:tetratricopeptide (TPR) repeat protein